MHTKSAATAASFFEPMHEQTPITMRVPSSVDRLRKLVVQKLVSESHDGAATSTQQTHETTLHRAKMQYKYCTKSAR